jgi:HSF-type DNA-binding
MLPINMSKKLPPLHRLRRKQREEGGDGESTGTSTARSAEIDVSQRLHSAEAVAKLSPLHDRKKTAADTKESSFQYKLYDILQCDDFKEILTWLPHGRSWKIIDSDALTKDVLPKYFRHSKYSSFKRQMSGWGFRRGIKVNEYNEYNHPVSASIIHMRCFASGFTSLINKFLLGLNL